MDLSSFTVIRPFIKPLWRFIEDEEVTEIMVNGNGKVFTESRGHLSCHPEIAINQKSLHTAVTNIAVNLGIDYDEKTSPILDARLADGSRVAAVLSPCSVDGITLTIRKFQSHRWTLDELLKIGAITHEMTDRVRTAILQHQNILISGGTGTGKTTMLNALAALLPPDERLIIIEDTAEIQLNADNLVRFEARRQQEGISPVTIRDLLKATLRHRPDRILLGEIRGGEAFDLLQALNTGHSGSLSTIHANSALQALSRFSSCVLQSGVELPYKAIQALIADSIQYILHIQRRNGRRYASTLAQVLGYDHASDRYRTAIICDREYPTSGPGTTHIDMTSDLTALKAGLVALPTQRLLPLPNE